MSSIIPAPYTLTDAKIAAVISSATVNGKLTDAGISAVVSANTIGAKMGGVAAGAVGDSVIALSPYPNTGLANGSTYPGANLRGSGYISTNVNGQTPEVMQSTFAFSGTWMCTGDVAVNASGFTPVSTFRRIA